MKNIKLIRRIGGLFFALAFLAACDKIDTPEPLGDDGQTVVKLLGGGRNASELESGAGLKLTGVDFVAVSQTLDIADIRRDVPSNAELNRTMNVTVKDDTSALRIYNDSLIAHGGIAILTMPEAWYSLNIPRVGGAGGTYSVTLQPGEFAKQISVTIPNATLLNPSNTYGFAFTIVSADADAVISWSRTIIFEIGAKNKYDGVYKMNSFHNRPGFQLNIYDEEMQMITTGANSVDFYWPLAGSLGHPIMTTTGISWYGAAIAPRVTFDPVSNLGVSVVNTGSATIIDMLAPSVPLSGVTRYDEGTKTMYVYWRYNLNNDRAFMDTLTYVRPR